MIFMEADDILDRYSLDRDLTAQYIDAITYLNQSETAKAIGVSRQTVNRYKNAFQNMDAQERLLLIASLTQDKLLEQNRE